MNTTMFPQLLLFLFASLVISYLMVARRRSFGKAHSLGEAAGGDHHSGAIDEGSNVAGMYAYNVMQALPSFYMFVNLCSIFIYIYIHILRGISVDVC